MRTTKTYKCIHCQNVITVAWDSRDLKGLYFDQCKCGKVKIFPTGPNSYEFTGATLCRDLDPLYSSVVTSEIYPEDILRLTKENLDAIIQIVALGTKLNQSHYGCFRNNSTANLIDFRLTFDNLKLIDLTFNENLLNRYGFSKDDTKECNKRIFDRAQQFLSAEREVLLQIQSPVSLV